MWTLKKYVLSFFAPKSRRTANEERGRANVEQGRWGEDMACAYFRKKGWRVLERNVRPCAADQRYEIDLIVSDPERRVVFVEVKTHKTRPRLAGRLAGVNRHKKELLLRACSNWLMKHKWHGNFRFDVVEVYGFYTDGKLPEIDHIENVPLFPPNWRFW